MTENIENVMEFEPTHVIHVMNKETEDLVESFFVQEMDVGPLTMFLTREEFNTADSFCNLIEEKNQTGMYFWKKSHRYYDTSKFELVCVKIKGVKL